MLFVRLSRPCRKSPTVIVPRCQTIVAAWGRRGMRYPGSEKLEIIGLVEQSHLPVRRTLAALGILQVTCYRWYACLQAGGPEAQEDNPSRPRRVWTGSQKEVRSRSPNWHWTSRICRRGKCPKPQRAALKAIPGNPDKRRVQKFEPLGMASSLRLLVWTKRSERSGFTRYKIAAGPAAGTYREVLATWVGACVEHALAAAEGARVRSTKPTMATPSTNFFGIVNRQAFIMIRTAGKSASQPRRGPRSP